MTTCPLKILFLHGLDSSRESARFHAINADHKYCIDVDYRNLNFQTVANFYREIIAKIPCRHSAPETRQVPQQIGKFRRSERVGWI